MSKGVYITSALAARAVNYIATPITPTTPLAALAANPAFDAVTAFTGVNLPVSGWICLLATFRARSQGTPAVAYITWALLDGVPGFDRYDTCAFTLTTFKHSLPRRRISTPSRASAMRGGKQVPALPGRSPLFLRPDLRCSVTPRATGHTEGTADLCCFCCVCTFELRLLRACYKQTRGSPVASCSA